MGRLHVAEEARFGASSVGDGPVLVRWSCAGGKRRTVNHHRFHLPRQVTLGWLWTSQRDPLGWREGRRLGKLIFSRAGVTQLAECLLPKQNVAGSNPVSRSTPLHNR